MLTVYRRSVAYLSYKCNVQVSSWGGYVFLINLIPLHVLALMVTGRFSHRVYVAYSTVTLCICMVALVVAYQFLTTMLLIELIAPIRIAFSLLAELVKICWCVFVKVLALIGFGTRGSHLDFWMIWYYEYFITDAYSTAVLYCNLLRGVKIPCASSQCCLIIYSLLSVKTDCLRHGEKNTFQCL